ncbi:PREDICTED: uncharacterized protein LOC106748068 [Dinoponera quadriceps]|uniref:Uncharacterized protein LOC106748068 n=1 Tax=Dinoponera quadriceps TaxID=609295 RepID=A0A6P3XTG9_DINQU|nr:PREDICTED: uncharacterized protein LOC106748068 [Dinoponera quadriceps]
MTAQMDETQKIRDRKMRGMRSSNRTEDGNSRTERAKNIIEDLERHGPAGLIHIAVLSNIIGKSIKIHNADKSSDSIIGKETTGPMIIVEYHANNLEGTGGFRIVKEWTSIPYLTKFSVNPCLGHWTLQAGKDPDNTDIDLNSCLFSVIGSQTGLNPSELRKWTILRLKGNLRQLADQLDKILQLEGTKKGVLMIGGARYSGTSANDAGIVLDKSQNARCYAHRALGHPRGHASDPSATGSTDNVENYSLSTGSAKTGFLSRADQNLVTHSVLRSDNAYSAMQRLNGGSTNEVVEVWPSMLRYNGRNWPRARWYARGYPSGPEQDIRQVLMVLRHHDADYRNQDADVFIHTCYPKV